MNTTDRDPFAIGGADPLIALGEEWLRIDALIGEITDQPDLNSSAASMPRGVGRARQTVDNGPGLACPVEARRRAGGAGVPGVSSTASGPASVCVACVM